MIALETLARELATLRQIEGFCVVRALVCNCPTLWTFDNHARDVSTFSRSSEALSNGGRSVRQSAATNIIVIVDPRS
jgi:hypothetical protein